MGKEGAISIHRYVQKGQSLTFGRTIRSYVSLDKNNINLESYDRLPRQKAYSSHETKNVFEDTRGTLNEEQIKKETERCLGCGATVVDEFMCVGCGVCTTKCKFDAISLVKKYDNASLDLKDLKPAVMKQAIKRKLKITVKKPIKAIKSVLFSSENDV